MSVSLLDWLNPASWITSAVTAIGGTVAKTVVEYHKDSLDAGNTFDRTRADLALRELAVQETEIKAQTQLRIAEIGHWYEPDHIASYIFVAYIAKVVIYDVMLGLGTTDAIHGSVGDWLGLIAMFLFGKRGAENIARILKR